MTEIIKLEISTHNGGLMSSKIWTNYPQIYLEDIKKEKHPRYPSFQLKLVKIKETINMLTTQASSTKE